MIRVKVPGSSFMLCLGPGPPSLLCMTRANLKSPYAGGTVSKILDTKKVVEVVEEESTDEPLVNIRL